MNNTDMIKELRALTQAGMKDCKESLEEAGWDLQKAVDLVKKKGLNVVSGREGKVASEGMVAVSQGGPCQSVALVEVNCQTDFVAKNTDFVKFTHYTVDTIANISSSGSVFSVDLVESLRQNLVMTTKENVVVRRWWFQEALSPNARVFTYVHSNGKIGVLLTLLASSEEIAKSTSFSDLGNDLAMQIAAMNPLAISVDHLLPDDVNRQKSIFQAQLVDLKKPQAAWPKIMEGKLNKWYSEVCLLNQESITATNPKTTVAQLITKISGQSNEIKVVSFIRCQVGEGIEKPINNFVDEISKMSGV